MKQQEQMLLNLRKVNACSLSEVLVDMQKAGMETVDTKSFLEMSLAFIRGSEEQEASLEETHSFLNEKGMDNALLTQLLAKPGVDFKSI